MDERTLPYERYLLGHVAHAAKVYERLKNIVPMNSHFGRRSESNGSTTKKGSISVRFLGNKYDVFEGSVSTGYLK